MMTFSVPNAAAIVDAETLGVSAPSIHGFVGAGTALENAYKEICNALSDPNELKDEPVVRSFELSPTSLPRALDVVIGVGIGLTDDPEASAGEPGAACLHLYTSKPVSKAEAVNYVATAFSVQSALDQVPIRVIHTGPIDALHRAHMRPAPGGTSVGHFNVSAGTLGCLAKGRAAPRDSRLLVLSNNHVLANVNAGVAGDDIIQPGTADGGQRPQHNIGALERYVKIDFTQPNMVDCATAWVDPQLVRPELLYLSGGTPNYFKVGNMPKPAAVGMTVGKSGRTTGLTMGRIAAVGVNINVNMAGGRVANFVNQISIQGIQGLFSQGGDSGSLVWEWNQTRSPVGLLFAGGGSFTFANPIVDVLNALDIDLVT